MSTETHKNNVLENKNLLALTVSSNENLVAPCIHCSYLRLLGYKIGKAIS
jgi:hypothetical protein